MSSLGGGSPGCFQEEGGRGLGLGNGLGGEIISHRSLFWGRAHRSVIFACKSPSLWALLLSVLFSYVITLSGKLFYSQDVISAFHLPPKVCGFQFNESTKLRNSISKT